MNDLLDFLGQNGLMLLGGLTILLSLAAVLVLMHRAPIHRQRLAEASMVVCLLWIILACIPLPRFMPERTTTPMPIASKPLILQPGDEAIAAEVFKKPNQTSPDAVLEKLQAAPSPIDLATAPPPPPPINWRRTVSVLYLWGAAACGLWILLGNLLLCRLILRARTADTETSALYESLNPNRRIRLLICDHTERPISFGLLRPVILLPSRILGNSARLRHILLHELAHIRQRDALGHFLFNLLFPILYFHPLYWWLRQRTNLAREMIADDFAAAFTSRESYAADLLALARDRYHRAALSTQALGLFQSKTDFYRRMHMLVALKSPLKRECSLYWRLGWSTMLIVALIVVTGMLGVRRASAQAPAPDREREAQIQRLRAEQSALEANLKELEIQKLKLEADLEAKRNEDFRNLDLIKGKLAEDKAAMKLKKARDEEKLDFVDKNLKKDPRPAQQNVVDFSGRPQLDLVSLANSYVNAVGELKIQELTAERFAKGGNNFSDTEKAVARIHVETANRKVQIFRSIAEAAAEAAKADLETAHQQFKTGTASRSAVVEAESRLRILQIILSN